jgi:hypothetical protein
MFISNNVYSSRIYKNGEWILINGGADIDLEFDSVQNLGQINNPNGGYSALNVVYSNLKLKCNLIYSKRSTGLTLWNLYGKVDAKIGKIETGVFGIPNGETGSTALLTKCDGYMEIEEIIVNNVGHTLSPRGGIMHFKINKMSLTNNHPTYIVQPFSQIENQASTGISTTLEFGEITNNSGKYTAGLGILCTIGYLDIKGKKLVGVNDAIFEAYRCDAKVQIDYVEAKGTWIAGQFGPTFPYNIYVKNSTFVSYSSLPCIINYDINGLNNICNLTFDNVDIESLNPGGPGSSCYCINYPVSGFTAIPVTVKIKGLNSFNVAPNSLITFIGGGAISVNGTIQTRP